MHYSSSREGWKCLLSDIKNPAFPILLTCSSLFPLLAILVGWLTYCTNSPWKTEYLSVTDGDRNWKKKGQASSHYFFYLPLPEAAIFPSWQEGGLILVPLIHGRLYFHSSFCHTSVPVLIFFLPSHDTMSLSLPSFFSLLSLNALCLSVPRPYLIGFRS